MRAAAEVLDIARIGRGGAGLLGVGPGLLVRVLARLFIERHDALARLGDVRPGAEVLEVRGIRRHGTGLLGLGPRLLVRLFLRLLISRLLLRRALLRIRGLAASRYERSPRNDGKDRQFRKCDAPSTLGLLTQITGHSWPFSGVTRAGLSAFKAYARRRFNMSRNFGMVKRKPTALLPLPPTRRRRIDRPIDRCEAASLRRAGLHGDCSQEDDLGNDIPNPVDPTGLGW